MNGIFVETDGKIEVREYEEPIFKSVGADVGGYIERVKPRGLPRDFCFFCNEEGILERLPVNAIATMLYQYPIIAGNVVIFKEGYVEDGIGCIEMTEEDIERIMVHIKQVIRK